MEKTRSLWRSLATALSTPPPLQRTPYICTRCLHTPLRPRPTPSALRPKTTSSPPRRPASTQPGDSPDFHSIVDNPPTPIRTNRRHNPYGLTLLAAIPVTAFLLGCWQVQRLGWKTDLIARFEDRLVRDPLPLPGHVDPGAVGEFDYRRVVARGRWLHEKECLVGPRVHDGKDGFLVVTPLERAGEFPELAAEGVDTTVLVNRGWVAREKVEERRVERWAERGEVRVEGLLRSPWKRNLFTPVNRPGEGKWYFPDVAEMAAHVGCQAVWVEETMRPDLLETYRREEAGRPIGRAPEVNLRNNHVQYIFTWFSLSAATTVMMYMVLKRPAGPMKRRVKRNTQW